MKLDYENNVKIMKAIVDPNRTKIIDLLSCGEKCACDLLQHFEFTQPTLSHHMKVLVQSGLVISRKEGLWNYYSLNNEKGNELLYFLSSLISNTGNECICIDKLKCKCK